MAKSGMDAVSITIANLAQRDTNDPQRNYDRQSAILGLFGIASACEVCQSMPQHVRNTKEPICHRDAQAVEQAMATKHGLSRYVHSDRNIIDGRRQTIRKVSRPRPVLRRFKIILQEQTESDLPDDDNSEAPKTLMSHSFLEYHHKDIVCVCSSWQNAREFHCNTLTVPEYEAWRQDLNHTLQQIVQDDGCSIRTLLRKAAPSMRRLFDLPPDKYPFYWTTVTCKRMAFDGRDERDACHMQHVYGQQSLDNISEPTNMDTPLRWTGTVKSWVHAHA